MRNFDEVTNPILSAVSGARLSACRRASARHGYAIVIFLGNCASSSRNVLFRFSMSASGCITPFASVARDTSVCAPGVAFFQSNVNSFHENFVLPLSIAAACHGPLSMLTSTDFSGVPSCSTNPNI